MTIGTNLKKLREKRGLGQQEVCDAIGIAQGTLSNYEKDRRVPNPDMIKAFSTFFGVSSGSIIGDNQIFGFGDAFERERKNMNLSISQISNLTGIPEGDLLLFEGNLDSLSLQNAKKYASALDKQLAELYNESNSSITSIPESYRNNPKEYFNALDQKRDWILSDELDQLENITKTQLSCIIELFESVGYTYDINEEFNELVIDGPSFSKNFDISDLISSFEKLDKEKLMADALLFDQTENFSDDIQQIIDLFNKLNKEGQKEAVKQIDNLTYNPKYTKSIKLTPVMKEKPTNGYVIAAHNDNKDPDQLEKMERDGERMLAEAARRRAKRNE